ncbi:MAG: helix-turn-helix domain-containing protein [Bdellovibrionales bacterium]
MRTKKNWDHLLTAEAALGLKELGRLIQTARKRRKMSVVELASRAGADRRTISHLENGSPGVSVGVLIQVLSVLNLARGFNEALKPENDIDALAIELRKVRKRGLHVKRISDDEVNF